MTHKNNCAISGFFLSQVKDEVFKKGRRPFCTCLLKGVITPLWREAQDGVFIAN
jgi:hypothetical protein